MDNEQLARELGKIETTLESLKAGQETLHKRIDKLSAKIDEMPEKRQNWWFTFIISLGSVMAGAGAVYAVLK